MALTWYLCDLKTGVVWAELPLTTNGDLERTVGTRTTLGVTLAIHDPKCPANWYTLIDPMRAMIVVADDDDPLIGYVVDADSYGSPTGAFTLTSLESVLDASNVRDHYFSEGVDDEATVAATLLGDVIVPSFGFELDVTLTGQTADHDYEYIEDRTVGSALNDLMAADGGPEWTIRLAWLDGKHNQIVKTIQVAPTIGYVIPSVVIENQHIESRKRNRSFTRGNRATHVIATGDGSGGYRPMSAAHVDADAIAAGVPQWEVRIPVTGVDDETELDRYALAGLGRRRKGVTTWEMQLALSNPGCPRVGRDFDAGDTITIDSIALPDDPAEWHGLARVIGWRASIIGGNLSTVTPVFWEEETA